MIVFSEMRGQNKIFGSFWKMNGQNILFGPLISENSIVTPPLKFYDCLVFSWIINLYLLVVVFELLVVRKRSRFLSAVIVNKKTKPDSGRVQCCCGGIFLPCFFWRNTLSCITPKENWYVYLMPFRIACYTHKHE